MIGSGAINWAVEATLASALLMAFVFTVRAPVRRLFGPTVAYALWTLPALRMVLPPLPWSSAPDLVNDGTTEGGTVLFAIPLNSVAALDADGPSGTPAAILATVWAGGAVLFLLYHVVAHLRFCRGVIRGAVATEYLDGVRLIRSAAVAGPLAFGVRRPVIAVPLDFDSRYDADERASALAHEFGHHRRGDLHANCVALGVLAVHWWNPLAWAAYRAFRADQELAADARVLAGPTAPDPSVYARAILKAAVGRSVSPACNLNPVIDLKRRLFMLARSPISRRRSMFGGVTATTLVAVGLILTASGVGPEVSVAAAAAPADRQLRTIVARPDGRGGYLYVVRGESVAPGGKLPGDAVLPRSFELPGTCRSQAADAPRAAVIKGEGGEWTYTVLCPRTSPVAAAPGIERDAYEQALAGLRDLRVQVSAERQPDFPEAERRNVFAAIDASIAEIEGDLAALR